MRIGAAGVAAAGSAAALWGLAEAQAFTVRQRTLMVARQGAGTSFPSPLRVLHLSDIHLMPYQRNKLRWLESLADLKPDLVVMTGDQLASEESLPLLLDALAPLSGLPGAFVYGSNDYYKPHLKNPFVYFKQRQPAGHIKRRERELPWQAMTAAFESYGWLNLNNARGNLSAGGWDIQLVGVDDPHIELDEYPDDVSGSGSGGDSAAASRLSTNPNIQRITFGLTHAPYTHILDKMAGEGCTAVFAGHTHGGQVCIPGYGALVTNCDLEPKYASGMFQWPLTSQRVIHGDGIAPTGTELRPTSWVNISAGIGASPTAPVRVACRPEAVLVEFAAV